MKSGNKKESLFKIELPKEGDEINLASMHIQAWKESYVNSETGLTENKVDEMMGHMLVNTDYRRKSINDALTDPNNFLYRVVTDEEGTIVGFLHASKHEDHNELDAIYLLNEVKGTGIGGKLMEEFLSWADKDKFCHLKVLASNELALGFYHKYGFNKTDAEIELYKDILPVIEMIRPAEASLASS
jgi:ribosomal protein S18 acetylase RimI-like enzyme